MFLVPPLSYHCKNVVLSPTHDMGTLSSPLLCFLHWGLSGVSPFHRQRSTFQGFHRSCQPLLYKCSSEYSTPKCYRPFRSVDLRSLVFVCWPLILLKCTELPLESSIVSSVRKCSGSLLIDVRSFYINRFGNRNIGGLRPYRLLRRRPELEGRLFPFFLLWLFETFIPFSFLGVLNFRDLSIYVFICLLVRLGSLPLQNKNEQKDRKYDSRPVSVVIRPTCVETIF